MLTYGLENLVDFLSSVVVCWRFYSPGGTDAVHDATLQKREKRASVAISFVLFLLGLGVLIAALEDFAKGLETAPHLRMIVYMSMFSFITFGALTLVKFRYSKVLQSPSLRKDAICSLIGTVLSGSLLMNSLVILANNSFWWLDPLIALLCGTMALLIGTGSIYRALVVQGIPVCDPKWWLTSQGDGMDEVTGRNLTPADLGMEVDEPQGMTEMASEGVEKEIKKETEVAKEAFQQEGNKIEENIV